MEFLIILLNNFLNTNKLLIKNNILLVYTNLMVLLETIFHIIKGKYLGSNQELPEPQSDTLPIELYLPYLYIYNIELTQYPYQKYKKW